MSDANPSPNIESGLERLWQALQSTDSQELCRRAQVSLARGRYGVPFLGAVYEIEPAGRLFFGPPADTLTQDREFQLMLLGYLAGAREGEPPAAGPELADPGRWVSERQLPGGSLFFQGPHALPLSPLLRRFGQDAETFRRVCIALGGSPLPYGDAAFAFRALPRIPLGVLLWLGDDEFEPRAGILFDPGVTAHLPLDLILALVRAAVLRLEAIGAAIS